MMERGKWFGICIARHGMASVLEGLVSCERGVWLYFH